MVGSLRGESIHHRDYWGLESLLKRGLSLAVTVVPGLAVALFFYHPRLSRRERLPRLLWRWLSALWPRFELRSLPVRLAAPLGFLLNFGDSLSLLGFAGTLLGQRLGDFLCHSLVVPLA